MHVVCLAHFIKEIETSFRAKDEWEKMIQLFYNGINTGEVRPISATIFEKDEIEKAFRYMAAGKHIGKVLIKMRGENESKDQLYPCIAETYFKPDKSYIITGGLGGLGLEVALWMLCRGAANIILTSRSGIKEPYQQLAVRRLEENHLFKSKIVVSKQDCLTLQSSQALLEEAKAIAPIGGIFMLAMVLKDALIENQTIENFVEVCGPKALATKYLDQLTRSSCPDLEYFVCFSSVAAGKGNAGQSNYGLANSSMERVCEKRRRDGYPALAIQWGALGDVGFVAEVMGGNDINIAGTVPQRLPSIFETFDKFLQSPYPVVSSIVLADTKRSIIAGKESLLNTICHVLGVKDPTKLDPNSTLSDLGMDSLMTVEIKQGLERGYDLIMTTQEIRNLKIKDIPKIEESKKKDDRPGFLKNDSQESGVDFDPLEVPNEVFIPLNGGDGARVLMFPPIEGNFKTLIPIFSHLTRPITGANWNTHIDKYESVQQIGEFYVKKIRETYPTESQFDLVGYSFGGILALEVAMQLQETYGVQAVNKLILMDSSPDLFHAQSAELLSKKGLDSEDKAQVEVLVGVASCFLNIGEIGRLKDHLLGVKEIEKRYQVLADLINRQTDYVCDAKKVASAAERYFHKMKLTYFYNTSQKFNGDLTLIRCSESTDENVVAEFNVPDYGLSKVCLRRERGRDTNSLKLFFHLQYVTGNVQVYRIPGTHTSFIKENAEQVGSYLDTTLTYLQFA